MSAAWRDKDLFSVQLPCLLLMREKYWGPHTENGPYTSDVLPSSSGACRAWVMGPQT